MIHALRIIVREERMLLAEHARIMNKVHGQRPGQPRTKTGSYSNETKDALEEIKIRLKDLEDAKKTLCAVVELEYAERTVPFTSKDGLDLNKMEYGVSKSKRRKKVSV